MDTVRFLNVYTSRYFTQLAVIACCISSMGCGYFKGGITYKISSGASQSVRLGTTATVQGIGGSGPLTYWLGGGQGIVDSKSGLVTDAWWSGTIFVTALDPHGSVGIIPVTALPSAIEFGSPGDDQMRGVAQDSLGNVFSLGQTTGSFPGQPNAGGNDFLLVKYDKYGNQVWVRVFGTAGDDRGMHQGVAVDSSGNIYVTGLTNSAFPTFVNAGGYDIVMAKYDTNGNQLWLTQYGTAGDDVPYSIALDPAGVPYIVGYVVNSAFPGNVNHSGAGGWDAFVVKFTTAGAFSKALQFGAVGGQISRGIAIDNSGHVYVAGLTWGTFPTFVSAGGDDGYVAQMDTGLTAVNWVTQFGTAGNDHPLGSIAVDSGGNILVTGQTNGSFPGYALQGAQDIFVAKFDSTGANLWIKQFGTSGSDVANGLTLGPNDSFYVAAETDGAFPGNANAGGVDAVAMHFTSDGALDWTRQIGSVGTDTFWGLSYTPSSGVIFVGYSNDSLPNYPSANPGSYEGIMVKYDNYGNQQ
jgi:hypothetical protein